MITKSIYFAFERLEHSPSKLKEAGPWDFFISAYDETERVQEPFSQVQADDKQWVVQEEHGFSEGEWPLNAVGLHSALHPPAVLEYVKDRARELKGSEVCIDATGFIRPHLLILLRALRDIGVRSFDVLYSDPVRYVHDERTVFAGPVTEVKQVPGYEGIHSPSGAGDDLLVIGAGYDHDHIRHASEQKDRSKKYILTGLPSLQPHMYQESILRIREVGESIGNLTPQQWLYASANHPFAVAQVLHDLVEKENLEAKATGHSPKNLYLCPTGPKPHVIGFAIYYLREMVNESASIIYPFSMSYPRATSEGLLRTWQYRIEI